MNEDLVLSIDVETNGLIGLPFIVYAAVFSPQGECLNTFLGRCELLEPEEFVKEQVLPACEHIPINCDSMDDLLRKFAKFYLQYDSLRVISHIPFPVETNFFSLLQEDILIGEFQGPYPLIDVGSMLLLAGENPTSLEEYMKKHQIEPPSGVAHDPEYDAKSAFSVYQHLIARFHKPRKSYSCRIEAC